VSEAVTAKVDRRAGRGKRKNGDICGGGAGKGQGQGFITENTEEGTEGTAGAVRV
jgi:hypothetical protein